MVDLFARSYSIGLIWVLFTVRDTNEDTDDQHTLHSVTESENSTDCDFFLVRGCEFMGIV